MVKLEVYNPAIALVDGCIFLNGKWFVTKSESTYTFYSLNDNGCVSPLEFSCKDVVGLFSTKGDVVQI